jgi:hypothetical protein
MRLPKLLRRFIRDTEASLTVELVIMLPVLLWGYVATSVFFDAYNVQSNAAKATYTIADLLSRQREEVDAQFLGEAHDLFDWLLAGNGVSAMRVSSVSYDVEDEAYDVHWSYSSGGRPLQTDVSIADHAGQLPDLPEGDYVIVVETWLDYVPSFSVGLPSQTFENFTVTAPRFMPKLEYDG